MLLSMLYGYFNISTELAGSELLAVVMGVNTGYLGYLVMLSMIVAGGYTVALYNENKDIIPLTFGGALIALAGIAYYIATLIPDTTAVVSVITMLGFVLLGIGLIGLGKVKNCNSLYASGVILFTAGIMAMTTLGSILIILGTIMTGFSLYKQ